MRSTAAGILLLIATLILAGCGGGGSTTGNSSDPNTVTGTVSVNGVGLGQVSLSLTGGRVGQTDGNGSYTITNLTAGASYTITPYRSGYTFTPVSKTVTAGAIANPVNFTATAIPSYEIAGRVTSSNGGGLNGTTVNVTNQQSGMYVGSATTDGNGAYRIGALLDGGYRVTPSHPGDSAGTWFTPVTVTISGASQTVDFSAPVATHTVSGKVLLSGQGLANVVLTMSTIDQQHPMYSAISASDGSYAIAGLPDGYYGLWPVLSGYNFVESGVQISGADVTNNITAALPPTNGGSANFGL